MPIAKVVCLFSLAHNVDFFKKNVYGLEVVFFDMVVWVYLGRGKKFNNISDLPKILQGRSITKLTVLRQRDKVVL